MRGQRDKHAAEEAKTAGQAVQIIDVSEHKPRHIPSAKWRELIKKVWEADPPLCPRCSHEMRIVALIDERAVIERILRHLGLWQKGVRVSPRPFCPRFACARNAFEAGLDRINAFEAGLDRICLILLNFRHGSSHSDRFQRAGALAA